MKGVGYMYTREELIQKLAEVNERIGGNRTKVLSRCLPQPFTTSNSAYRKLMFAIHEEHALCIINPERPYVATGHENKFGEKSSSYVVSNSNLTVAAKIQKYPNIPNHHYWLITTDYHNKEIGVIERVSYKHTTESFGFLYNNEFLDNLVPEYDSETLSQISGQVLQDEWNRIMETNVGIEDGDAQCRAEEMAEAVSFNASNICKGEVIKKSTSFDSANNYRNGVNLLVAYLDENQLTEDPVEMSYSASLKFCTAEIKPIEIVVNDNDILINLHGNNEVYKPLPDVGETIQGNQLYCLRRENKEDALYTQSIKNLSKPMMSDETSPIEGMVVDIDVYCNNPTGLESHYNQQLKYYSDNANRYCEELVSTVDALLQRHPDWHMNHELETLYYEFKRRLEGVQFISSDKPFNNIVVKIVVVEHSHIKTGDKVSNRYGGKGVVAKIVVKPDEEMPIINGRHVDLLWRSSTGINRENAGQYKENCLNGISYQILNHAREKYYENGNVDDVMNEYLRFLSLTNPVQASKTRDKFYEYYTAEERLMFIDEILSQECIHVVLDPIYQNLTLNDFDKIMQEFPYVHPLKLTVPMEDCRGNIRWIETDRTIGVGFEYIYMLKQKAVEKYSESSFSSVNIRGDNSKDGNKLYRHLYKRTPIRVGHMENGSLDHIGIRAVITQAMLYGTSPTGRLNMAEILTGDPFNIDIKLTDVDRNRKAEIVATDLKGGMGLRLVIDKKPKVRYKLKKRALPFAVDNAESPEMGRKRQHSMMLKRLAREEANNKQNLINPFTKARQKRS